MNIHHRTQKLGNDDWTTGLDGTIGNDDIQNGSFMYLKVKV